MNTLGVVLVLTIASFVSTVEFAPTSVVSVPTKTVPPSETQNIKYVETVYKATNHKTMIHTLEPLIPSYTVSYYSTSLSTVNNQTVETASVEFATVLNTTVLYNSEMMKLYTYNGAATEYQTLDFRTQKVVYTPVTGNTSVAVTTTEANAIPFV